MSGIKGVTYQIKGANLAGPAMRQFQNQLQGVRAQTNALRPVQASWNKGLSENRRAIQQLGFQMTDFSVQIAGGQNAMLAFVQQGGQMLQVFGPMGAVLAAILTVFGTLALVIGKSGVAISEITPLLGVLQSELWFFVEAFRLGFEVIIWSTNLVLNNLDVLATMGVIYLGRLAMAAILSSNAFRALLFSMAVLGPVQGALAVGTWALTSAMVALRAVMMTVLPVLLLTVIAWLIVKFIELIQLAGGFGNAMKLLGDLVMAVFVANGKAAMSFAYTVKAGFHGINAAMVSMVTWVAEKWEGLVNTMIDGWNTVMDAFGAEGARASPWENSWVAGSAAVVSSELGKASASMDAANAEMFEASEGIIDSWTAITDLFKNGSKIDVRDWFGGASADKPGGGGGGGNGKGTTEALAEEAKEIKRIFDDISSGIENSLMSGFKAVLKGTKSLKDYALDVLDTILDKVIELLMQPVFTQIAGNIAGFLMGSFGGPVQSFAGGGYTGNGSRSGGLDGQGGYMAMLHPKESVVDHTLSGGGGFSGGTVHVIIHESESFMSTIDTRAEGVAVDVVRSGLSEYDRKVLPSSVSRIRKDPLVR